MFRRRPSPEQQVPGAENQGIDVGLAPQLGEVALLAPSSDVMQEIQKLSPQLQRFREEWDLANGAVSDYLDEPANHEIFESALGEWVKRGPQGSEMCGGHTVMKVRLKAHDMPRFVAAKILEARATGLRTLNNQSVHEVVQGGGPLASHLVVTRERAAIKSRWGSLLNTGCEHTPNVNMFFKGLNALASTVEPHYNKADQAAEKVQARLVRFVGRGPEHAARFLDTLEALAASDDPDHDALLRILSTDHVHNANGDSTSLINYAIALIEASIPQGAMVGAFLKEKAAGDDSHWVHFTQRMYSRLNQSKGDFGKFMESDLAHWPESWQEEYKAYAQEGIGLLRIRTKRDAQFHVDRQLIRPTLGEAFEATDRLIKGLGVNIIYEKKRGRSTQLDNSVSRGNHSASRVLPAEHAGERGRDKLKVGVLVRSAETTGANNSFSFARDRRLDDVIAEVVASQKQSERYEQEVRAIVKQISQQPYGPGTTRLEEKVIRLGGQKIKVRRFNPNHCPGLSVPNARESRIIYAVTEDTMAILGIFPNHDEYDRFQKTI